ncbi:MAG: hypothetical protein L6R37_005536 [Teloschistes peruensis]|nr:MAG: hypothetical protein L6R37_005536 [Teloschistes peruensis]
MIIRWEGGRATVPSKEDICRKSHMKPYDAATLFVQSESDNFWAVPFDAETQDVKEHPGGWNVLSFDHESQNGNTNAIYSCISTVGSETRLAAVGSPDWMPQLLPKEYDYDPVRTDDEPAVSAGLIGTPERGMVVTVYYDPRNEQGSHKLHLEQLENGFFGPFYQP